MFDPPRLGTGQGTKDQTSDQELDQGLSNKDQNLEQSISKLNTLDTSLVLVINLSKHFFSVTSVHKVGAQA